MAGVPSRTRLRDLKIRSRAVLSWKNDLWGGVCGSNGGDESR